MVRCTNTEVLHNIMEHGPTGALAQMFVIDALTKHAKHVIDNEDEVLKNMENGFIHGPAWVATAQAIKASLDEHLDQQPQAPFWPGE